MNKEEIEEIETLEIDFKDTYELELALEVSSKKAIYLIDDLIKYLFELQQENKKYKEVIDKAKSLNHEISHTIYEDFLEENIIGSKFLYERIKKQLSILEDEEVE